MQRTRLGAALVALAATLLLSGCSALGINAPYAGGSNGNSSSTASPVIVDLTCLTGARIDMDDNVPGLGEASCLQGTDQVWAFQAGGGVLRKVGKGPLRVGNGTFQVKNCDRPDLPEGVSEGEVEIWVANDAASLDIANLGQEFTTADIPFGAFHIAGVKRVDTPDRTYCPV